MDDGYEVLDGPPQKPNPPAKPVAKARPVTRPKPPADEYEVVEPPAQNVNLPAADEKYGVIDEPPARRPKPVTSRRPTRPNSDLDDEIDAPVEFRTVRKKGPSELKAEDYTGSRVYGAFLILLGAAMIVGFFLIDTAPKKLFTLLGAGGAGCVFSGLGLILFPLPPDALRAFKDEGSPLAVLREAPLMGKVWFALTVVVMVVAGIAVHSVLVPAGGRR